MSLSRLITDEDRLLAAEAGRAGSALAASFEPEERDAGRLGARARDAVAALGRAGILRHAVAPVDGGLPSLVRICAVRESLARAHGLADLAFAMQGLGTVPIALAGTPEQRARWLPAAASGEACTAFAITEEGAGSDVAAIATEASRAGVGWVLRGRKTFISNAGIADLYVVFARTDPRGREGLSAFLVTPDLPGFSVARTLDLTAPHPIGEISFDGVPLPPSALLGERGGGFKLAMDTLAFFRPSVGAAACGLAARALAESIERAKERKQFGKRIGDFQAIRFYLAEMATDLDAARLLVYRAARLRDDGETAGFGRASAMAKLAATELAQSIVDKAVQIHGGTGVLVGSTVERLYREVRALRIYEGTSEIQKLVIARDLLGGEGGA